MNTPPPTATIGAAVQTAVTDRQVLGPDTHWLIRTLDWLRGLFGHAPKVPAQPGIDESRVVAATQQDAREYARELDDNAEVHPLPNETVVTQVMGLNGILGTQAFQALALVEERAAWMIAGARTQKPTSKAVTAFYWIVLLVFETIAVKKPLTDMLGLTSVSEKWLAAMSVAVVSNIAGLALARAWHVSLEPDDDQQDGNIGRHVLRWARLAVAVSLIMFIVGLIWGRVLYASDADGGLEAQTADSRPAHALMIAGLMLLAVTVSFALKSTDLVADSRTLLRLDAGLQRNRVKSVHLLQAALKPLYEYVILEARCRELARVSPDLWREAFLAELPADTRDRWAVHLASNPPAAVAQIAEAAWVGELKARIAVLQAVVRQLALPACDGATDMLDVIDLREPAHSGQH